MKPGIQEKPISSLPRVPWLGGGFAAVARGSSPRGSRGLPWDVAPGSEVTPQGTRRTFGLQRTTPLPRLSGEGVRTGGAPAGGASGLSGHDGLRRVAAFISESMRTLGEPAAAPPVPLRSGPALFSPASPLPSRPVPSLLRDPESPGPCRSRPAAWTKSCPCFLSRVLLADHPPNSPRALAPCRLKSPPCTRGEITPDSAQTQLSVQAQNNLRTALGREGSEILTFIL